MHVQRLHPSNPESWALWPVFERRVADFNTRVVGEALPEPFMQWLRDTFVNRSQLLGGWLAFEGDQVLGHLLSYADAFFGEPFVFVHQCEALPGAVRGTLHARMVEELRQWVDEMNWAYEQARAPQRIRRIKFATERAERAWKLFLTPLGTIERTRTLITLRLPEPAPTVAAPLVPPPGLSYTPRNGTEA